MKKEKEKRTSHAQKSKEAKLMKEKRPPREER